MITADILTRECLGRANHGLERARGRRTATVKLFESDYMGTVSEVGEKVWVELVTSHIEPDPQPLKLPYAVHDGALRTFNGWHCRVIPIYDGLPIDGTVWRIDLAMYDPSDVDPPVTRSEAESPNNRPNTKKLPLKLLRLLRHGD